MGYPPEISDVIVDYDPETLVRRPVSKAAALAKLQQAGKGPRGVVAGIGERDGILDAGAVDKILLRAHAEIQQLAEEFMIGQRVLRVLAPLVESLLSAKKKVQIVDVGCGLGYLIRWLAARRSFDRRVRLTGMDYNQVLVSQAGRLAVEENLRCDFMVGNALRLDTTVDIFISNGVLHHFRQQDLAAFFAGQAARKPAAFVHFDIQRSWATPLGAWLFHVARMREPLARCDGYLSAVRAHSGPFLLHSVRQGAPAYSLAHHGRMLPLLPFIRTMHAVVGILPELKESFVAQLGSLASTMRWSA